MRDHDDPSGRSAAPSRLKRRAEFLRVGKGRRFHATAMTIQAAARTAEPGAADGGVPRFGFTLTKKVGCAVVRNRARRRLREAVRLAGPDLPARADHDYVIVGRLEAIRLPFAALAEELARGLDAVHSRGVHSRGKPRSARGDAGAPSASKSPRPSP